MHEMGLARKIVALSIEEAGRQHARQIASVRVEVSPLAAIDTDELPECFALAARGTLAEGASLQVERMPLVGHCTGCGEHVALDVSAGALGSCPRCSASLEIPAMPEWRIAAVDTST